LGKSALFIENERNSGALLAWLILAIVDIFEVQAVSLWFLYAGDVKGVNGRPVRADRLQGP
jgi:hypothetical protein